MDEENVFGLVQFFYSMDVQVHHFQVRKCGPLFPSIFGILSFFFYFHKNNQLLPIKEKVMCPLIFFGSFNINLILKLRVHLKL